MKNFDIVTALLALAGRIAQRRAEKAVKREAALLAAIEATREAYGKAVEHRVNTNWRHQDIKRVS
ncbi:hypothetical protein Kallioja_00027 [Pseudomonas phage vB_PpuP-Kallioja]